MLKSTNKVLMSTRNVRQLVQDEVNAFRKEVEDHLAAYPIGAVYFGLKAARNPRLVERLREGSGVTLQTIETVRIFMAERKAAAESEPAK